MVSAQVFVSRSRRGARPGRISDAEVASGSMGRPNPSSTTPSSSDQRERRAPLRSAPGDEAVAGVCDVEGAHEGCGWRRRRYPGEGDAVGLDRDEAGLSADALARVGVPEETPGETQEEEVTSRSALFRPERSEDRVTSPARSASSSASRSHSACHSLESTEFRARAPAALRGVSIAPNAVEVQEEFGRCLTLRARGASRFRLRLLPPAGRKIPAASVATPLRGAPASRRGTPGHSLPPAKRPHVLRSNPARGGGTPHPRPHVPGFL